MSTVSIMTKKWMLVDENGDCVWTKVTIPACFDTTKGGLLFYSFNSKHYSIIPSDNYKMDGQEYR